jgi:type II secretory pathway pseudopilin PulG
MEHPMTSQPLALSSLKRGRRAFTLVELLAVIGIIVMLLGLVVVGVFKAQKTANASRIKADLATISQALEQYHNDLGVYPMSTPGVQGPNWTHVLAKALLSPETKFVDGQDGFGFRIQRDAANQPTGKIYPAYLNSDSFKTRTINGQLELLDHLGSPIAYYPRRNRPKGGTIPLVTHQNLNNQTGTGYYHQQDGMIDPDTNQSIQAGMAWSLAYALGYRAATSMPSTDYILGPGETQNYDGPFILVSPGINMRFNTLPSPTGLTPRQAMTDSDDIYNFEWK